MIIHRNGPAKHLVDIAPPTVDAHHVPRSQIGTPDVALIAPVTARDTPTDAFLTVARRSAPETSDVSPFDTQSYYLMLGGSLTLSFGDRGPEVEVLQRALNLVAEKTGNASIALTGTGVYGVAVENAVRALQADAGLAQTGIFGAAEAARLLVLLENAGGSDVTPRALGGLPALEAQFKLGELLEVDRDLQGNRSVHIYERGTVELDLITGLPAIVEFDGIKVPGAVILRAMENGLGAFRNVNSDGFAQLHFGFEGGTVTSAGGQVLHAARSGDACTEIAEQLGLGRRVGRSVGGAPELGAELTYQHGKLVYDQGQVLSHVMFQEGDDPRGSVMIPREVLEIALFRELGEFKGAALASMEDGSPVTRFRFARGYVLLDADREVRMVASERLRG
jgi:peptidoglycan hydrolase-like protein with peptidoglycan-binding domain